MTEFHESYCSTPLCDNLEKLRIDLKQERTAAYGDALVLAKKNLNVKLLDYKNAINN